MTTTTKVFLTRKQHDQVLDADSALLRKAFAECKQGREYAAGAYQWSLAGVALNAVSSETAAAIKGIIE